MLRRNDIFLDNIKNVMYLKVFKRNFHVLRIKYGGIWYDKKCKNFPYSTINLSRAISSRHLLFKHWLILFNVKSRSLETCDTFIEYSLAWPVLSQMQRSIFHPYTPSPELKKETTQRDTSNITPDISARALARLIYPLVFGFAITCLHNREKIHWRIVANKLCLRSHKDYRQVSLLQYPFYNGLMPSLQSS